MKLDILAFAVHPDDVELSCSGTLMSAIADGKKVGVVDLTRGELGTRGTAETRLQEATEAAIVMGLHVRENLEMADGFIQNDQQHQLRIIQSIRKYQPEIILANAIHDRHPDHGKSAKLVSDAAFLSGLVKIKTKDENENIQKPWKASYVFHYIQDEYIQPDFLIDISKFHARKIESILCYKTQFFNSESNDPKTYISSNQYLETIKGRAQIFGKRIGVEYAEGFTSSKMIGFSNFDSFIKNPT